MSSQHEIFPIEMRRLSLICRIDSICGVATPGKANLERKERMVSRCVDSIESRMPKTAERLGSVKEI